MIWFILYAIAVSLFFCFYYLCHKKLHEGEWLYYDSDSVGFALLMSIFWLATVWIGIPYILINLYKLQK